jgi:hypothetical protein
MYFERRGVERPKYLAQRQGALNARRPLKSGEIISTDAEIEAASDRGHNPINIEIHDLYDLT